ncbi:hypothetical protein Tco_0749916 [Tanacetum coccineum]|uniref:Uncharacterized protein n=1 Tax=Tanacetum coccineum TaxID=301880 RepID=A0ABQ4Z0T7_9ASTR
MLVTDGTVAGKATTTGSEEQIAPLSATSSISNIHLRHTSPPQRIDIHISVPRSLLNVHLIISSSPSVIRYNGEASSAYAVPQQHSHHGNAPDLSWSEHNQVRVVLAQAPPGQSAHNLEKGGPEERSPSMVLLACMNSITRDQSAPVIPMSDNPQMDWKPP